MLNKHKLYIPPEGPPQGIKPNPEIFEKMGEDAILKMIEDLYEVLGRSSIGELFPVEDREAAAKRSAAFFIFILGGPPRYQEKYGHPMMRQRHMPFKIDENARQVWLDCFREVLIKADEKYGFPMEHLPSFWHFLDRFSSWMVNSK
jgi:hemoglobin